MITPAKRGQYTTEYLIIIGLGIAIIGIFLAYVSLYYMSFSSTAGSKTLDSAASSLISQASYVSSEGSGSETTFSVAFPSINPAQSYFCGSFLKLTSGSLTSIQKSSIALTGLLPTTAGTYDVHETNTNGLAEVALSQTVSYINSSYKLSGSNLFYVLYFYNDTGGISGDINFNITVLSLSGKYITSQVETSSNGYYSGEIPLTSTQPEYLIEIFPIGYNVFSSSCFAPLATTFQEKYLSGGTSWSVSFDGQSGSAGIGSEIIIPTNGTGGPFTANATVSGLNCHSSVLASVGQTVTISNWNCTTAFRESGLPSGTEWWTIYNNNNISTTSTSISFYGNAGAYTFEDKSPITQGTCPFTASPESGSLPAGETQVITYSSSCQTTFTESGLPSSTSWWVEYDSSNLSSTGTSITFTTSYAANVAYTVGDAHAPGCPFTPSPSSGTLTTGNTQAISYSSSCTTTFTESGLPSSTSWWVEYDSSNLSSTGTSITFTTSYAANVAYTVGDVHTTGCTFTPSPSSGTLTTGNSQAISYSSSCTTTFTEDQLPTSTSWWVDYDSINKSSTNTSITFTTSYAANVPVTVGDVHTTGCTFSPENSGTATTGSSVPVPFGSGCTTTFTESGLPSSTSWWVDYNNYEAGNASSTGTSIVFSTQYFSNVAYTVGNAYPGGCKYAPSPSSGTLTTGNSQAISYSIDCTTTFTESGLPSSTSWWVDYHSTNLSSNGTSITFPVSSNTNSAYSVGNVYAGCHFTPSPSSGTLTQGSSQSISYSTSCNLAFLIPVKITNSQSSATASPFQQLVNVSSSVYSGPAASNFQNVKFVYPNGTTIPSWLENYTSSHATWWLKLGSIPASSSITVYMGFDSTSTDLLNTVNDGAAPQITESTNVPSGVVYDVPLRVSNSQNSPTSSPFQQIINLSSSVWGGHAGSYMQNIEFFYPNGTIIPSWLEYYNLGYATWWIKLGSIPADSSIVVYIGFASTSTNLFNGNTIGEAPLLSTSAPPYIQKYVPITLTNSQSSATVSPFDEEINVPSSDYSSYAASNLQNVEFYYQNGTIIPSWLENKTSSNAIWWLKLGRIPASSSITVYMGFASTSTNLFNNVDDGEAPQLSPAYAEYDDGFNVFNFYDDFKGTSLNTSKWTSSGAVSVDNGVTLGAGGVAGQINTISKSVVPSNMNLMGITYGTFNATTNSYSSMNYGLNAPTASYITDLQGKNAWYFTYYAYYQSSGNKYGNTIAYSGTHTGLYTFNASNDDKLTMDVVGHGVSSESYSAVSPYGNFTARTGIGPEIINYIAIASLPPNSVMPSASYGSATAVSSTYGEYDNGANVFNNYWNFAGTTIPSGFSSYASTGTTISISNGLTINTGSGNSGGIISSFGFTPPVIVEGYITSQSGGAESGGIAQQNGNSPTSPGYDFNEWGGSIGEGSLQNGMSGTQNINLQIEVPGVDGEAWVSSSLQYYYKDYNQFSASSSDLSLPSTIYISAGVYCCSSSNTITFQWLRTRAYPPNGVMPSVTVGSSYGQYDDGPNVFNFYSNFAGTSLNTNQWTTPTIPYTVDNGLTLEVPTTSGAYGSIDTVPTFSSGSVFDFYGEPTTNNGGSGFDFGVGDCINCNPPGDSWMVGASSGNSGYDLYLDSSTATTNYVRSYGVWTVGLESNGETAFSEYNYGDEYTVTDSSFSVSPNNYLILIHNGDLGNTFVQWFLERNAPPNGVMPSVSFGSGFAP